MFHEQRVILQHYSFLALYMQFLPNSFSHHLSLALGIGFSIGPHLIAVLSQTQKSCPEDIWIRIKNAVDASMNSDSEIL